MNLNRDRLNGVLRLCIGHVLNLVNTPNLDESVRRQTRFSRKELAMNNKSCALVCWILFFSLPAFALEIKLSTRELDTIPWIPITINVDVINDSSAPVEIPMVGRFSFGAGNICMNYMKKVDGNKPNQKEFDYMVVMSDQAPGPWKLTTDTLMPSESRSYTYSHGKAIEPMVLEYWVECNFLLRS